MDETKGPKKRGGRARRSGTDATDVLLCEAIEKAPGSTVVELAKAIDAHESNVRERLHRPEWIELFKSRHLPIRTKVDVAKPLALRRLIACLGAYVENPKDPKKRRPDFSVIERAAVRILGRDLDPAPEDRAMEDVKLATAAAVGALTADTYLEGRRQAEKEHREARSARARKD